MEFEFSNHAKNVIIERGIAIEWVERVIREPKLTECDKADPALKHLMAPIPEYGNRVLRVIKC